MSLRGNRPRVVNHRVYSSMRRQIQMVAESYTQVFVGDDGVMTVQGNVVSLNPGPYNPKP
jgi:hypothetical protein